MIRQTALLLAGVLRYWFPRIYRTLPRRRVAQAAHLSDQISFLFGEDICKKAWELQPVADLASLERTDLWAAIVHGDHSTQAHRNDLQITLQEIPEVDRILLCRRLLDPSFVSQCIADIKADRQNSGDLK